jgi:alcohol dehydrogenase class IV
VTKNAVLTDPGRHAKKSIRRDDWFARAAVIDPELTVSVPPSVTASSGGDALCQAIEAYVSIGAGPVTDALCENAIRRIGRALLPAYKDGSNLGARADMLYGSLLAGMALANARLGAVHGMAHPLGHRYEIPHGVICALLLPYVMSYNLDHAQEKYARVAALLGVNTRDLSYQQAAERAVSKVTQMVRALDIPLHLEELGVKRADWTEIIEASLPSGSLQHNPRPMRAQDVRAVLEMAF